MNPVDRGTAPTMAGLAEHDLAFLASDAARPVRLLLEYLRAEVKLQGAKVHSTVVVWGSARIPSPEEVAAEPGAPLARWARYYEEARGLAGLLAAQCGSPECLEFVVATGGGPGIMEAANRGAAERGEVTLGFNIELPHEQRLNPYVLPEWSIQFHYFALRKLHFMMRARALVAFPGGFGTLDELFEALTLVQTGKIERIPIVLVGGEYWRRVVDWDYLVDEGFIARADRELITIVETGREAAQRVLSCYAVAP
jgi:uncharacterized protein (TIGR00730 family)